MPMAEKAKDGRRGNGSNGTSAGQASLLGGLGVASTLVILPRRAAFSMMSVSTRMRFNDVSPGMQAGSIMRPVGRRRPSRIMAGRWGVSSPYGIAGHHGGLPDGGKADDRALLSRLEGQIPLGHDRWKGRIGLPDPPGSKPRSALCWSGVARN